MSGNGGRIVVDFTIDNGQAVVAVKQSGQILQQLKGTLESTAKSVKNLERHQDSLGRKFRDIVLTMGNLRFVAMDVNDVFLRLPMSILRTSGELEKMQALMKGLSKEITDAGKATEGQRGFDFITKMAKTTPFELKALGDTFVKFKTAGIDPTNGSMMALVDSVARFGGNGETLKRASVAIQQMSGKGVISMEELRQQLGEAVPTAMQDMADQMGVSMGELAKVVETGTLKAGPAIGKMLLRMQVNNAGAAEAMMRTWTGMTAQLQTQWDLTAKLISDSGFATEAKRVIDDLMAVMNSKEGRGFAISFGQSLAEAVTTLSTVAKSIVQYSELIKSLGLAWLGYKAVTSFIVPYSDAMRASWEKAERSIATQIGSARALANAERLASLERAQAYKSDAVAAQQRSAQIVSAKITEMAQLDRLNAEILAKQARLNAALAAAPTRTAMVNVPFGSGVPGLSGVQSQNEVKAAYAGLTSQMNANRAAGAALVVELSALQARHRALSADVVTTTASMAAFAGKTSTARTAVMGAAGALTGTFRFALAAMGGWVGLAITAVAALVGWMFKLKGAADEAAAAVSRAKNNQSSKKDLEESTATEASALEKLNRLKEERARIDGMKVATRGQLNQADARADRKNIKDLEQAQAQYAAATEENTSRRLSVERQAAEEEARGILTAVDHVSRAQREADNRTLAEMQGRNATALSKLKEDSKERKAAAKKFVDEEAAFAIESRKRASASTLSAAGSQLDQSKTGRGAGGRLLTEAERKAAADAHVLLMKDWKEQQGEIEVMMGRLNSVVDMGGKKGGGAGKGTPEKFQTPIEQLVIKLKSDRAELDSEVASFMGSFGKADKALSTAAKIRAKGKEGGFDYKLGKGKVKAKQSDWDEQADFAEVTTRRKSAIDAAGQLAEKGLSIEDDYKRALRIISDPLALTPALGKAGEFDDLLAKHGGSLEKLGKDAGLTGDELTRFIARMEAIRAKAVQIDLAGQIQKVTASTQEMADETQRINIGLIRDDQERTRRLAELDDILFKRKMDNQIALLRESQGAGSKEVIAAEAALAKNMEARAERTVEATKTPMQKMVDEWGDSTKAMNSATAQWAQQGVDSFVNFAKTGKFEFKSLVTDILAGLLKIELQRSMSQAMGGKAGDSSPVAGLLGSAASWVGSWVGSFFADGGIMSQHGSIPLRKYAAGGIANSPQLAVFGEGRMNEAYVPLPDGRSIPVTMTAPAAAGASGAAQQPTNVVVNVINQSGNPVSAKQGNTRLDAGQMVLDVVLSAANSPGPFRDSMKRALG